MNMSYCKFQNTLKDLEDCLDSICDELGPEEHKAREALIKVARNIVIADDDGVVPEKSIAENDEE